MSPASLRLIGNVSDICRPVYSSDNQEQVTVSVEGAEPLYAEIRIPNKQGVETWPKSSGHNRAGFGGRWLGLVDLILCTPIPGPPIEALRGGVRKLIVSVDFRHQGFICKKHHYLSLDPTDCPFCGKKLVSVENLRTCSTR